MQQLRNRRQAFKTPNRLNCGRRRPERQSERWRAKSDGKSSGRSLRETIGTGKLKMWSKAATRRREKTCTPPVFRKSSGTTTGGTVFTDRSVKYTARGEATLPLKERLALLGSESKRGLQTLNF